MADIEELVISPKTDTGKGRAFHALKVSAVMADALWETGKIDKHERPVCATFAASDAELRPFIANLICGRPADRSSTSSGYHRRVGYEFLKSTGYKVAVQKHEEGSLATVYLPELLDVDPGMVDENGIKFVILPGVNYLREQARGIDASSTTIESIVRYARCLPLVKAENEPEKDWQGHVRQGWEEPLTREVLAGMVPLAYLFTLYLSNRSRAPIPPDGKFYLQLFLACLQQGLASYSMTPSRERSGFGCNSHYKFVEEHADGSQFAPGIAFMATHEEVEARLATECADYFKRVEK